MLSFLLSPSEIILSKITIDNSENVVHLLKMRTLHDGSPQTQAQVRLPQETPTCRHVLRLTPVSGTVWFNLSVLPG